MSVSRDRINVCGADRFGSARGAGNLIYEFMEPYFEVLNV